MRKRYIITEIIIWTVILGIVFTGIIFAYSKLFVEPNVYTIQFKDIDGITKGSPVRFMGINVGYVRRLKSKNKYVDVKVLITKKDVKIPNGTVARVEFYGLGGSKSIELMPSADPSKDAGIVTGDNIRINDVLMEVTGMVDVLEQIEEFVKGIDKNGVLKTFQAIASFENTEVEKVNSKINNTTKKVKDSASSTIKKQENLNKKVEKLNKIIKK